MEEKIIHAVTAGALTRVLDIRDGGNVVTLFCHTRGDALYVRDALKNIISNPQSVPDFTVAQHIEAGSYPKDSKGRSHVFTRGGDTALIYTIDENEPFYPIAGRLNGVINTWTIDGRDLENEERPDDLMPPSHGLNRT